MKQRLGIARCLIADPLLMILDEPMNGLDPAGIEELREMIRMLVEEGRTVFMSSHLLDEVQKACDSVAIIDRGRILMQGPVTDITTTGRPSIRIRCDRQDEAAALLGAHPRASGVQQGDGAAIVEIDAATGADLDAVIADMNRRLVAAGIAVYALEPVKVSLERRFLEMTTRLEAGE
jgi:ABC-2 type transport system ATP-binding protein